MVHICGPSSRETEVGGSEGRGDSQSLSKPEGACAMAVWSDSVNASTSVTVFGGGAVRLGACLCACWAAGRMSVVGDNGMSVTTVIGWGRAQVRREGAVQVSVSAYVHV